VLYGNLNMLTYEINKLEFPWGLVSNGFSWSDEIFKIFKNNNLASVTISLDGLEEEHNWLRGHKSSFKNAVKTIKKLCKEPICQVFDVITCVNKRNIYKLDNIKELLINLGVKNWRLFTIAPIGRATKTDDLFLNELQYKHMLDKLLEYKTNKNININLAACSYLGQNYELKIKKYRFFCKAGINVAGIMVNGDILACPNIDRKFKQGNVFKDSFIDTWEKQYKVFRNRTWMKNDICSTCKDWSYCQGEGFHLRDYETKKTKLCYLNEFKL
jgi:radical SAM protein with 4Fe4S-binding SPASM domain